MPSEPIDRHGGCIRLGARFTGHGAWDTHTGHVDGPGLGPGPGNIRSTESGLGRYASGTEDGAEIRASDSEDGAFLAHERLDVYRVAIDLTEALMAAMPRKGHADLRDQVERASTSVVLNIAEGAGRTSFTDKRRFYEIAKGSTTECAAALDVLKVRGVIDAPAHARARTLAIRVVQMLSRLAAGPR